MLTTKALSDANARLGDDDEDDLVARLASVNDGIK